MKFEALTPTPKPSKAAIRRSIGEFEKQGFTSHSTMGIVAAHILNHCVRNGIPFALAYMPGGGYSLWRLPREPHSLKVLDELAGTAVDEAK